MTHHTSSSPSDHAKLLMTSGQLQHLKSLLSQQLKVKGQTEFEMRITKINTGNRKQIIPFSELEIRRLYHQCSKESSRTQYIEDTVYSKSKQEDIVYRKIVSKNDTQYQTKYKPRTWLLDVPFVSRLKFASRKEHGEQKTLDPGLLSLTNIRFSKAVETGLSEEEYKSLVKPEYVRKRQRSVYQYRNGVQIHLTKVTNLNDTASGPHTEIEVEVDISQITEARSLLMTVKPVFGLLFPSLYCYYSFEKFQTDQLFYLPSFIINPRRPVNIQEKHYTPRLLNYAVTNKLDGVEYKLWFQKKSEERMDILLFNDVQVRFVQSLPFCIENNLPLFKCEVVDGPSGKPSIHIFDTSSEGLPSSDGRAWTYNLYENGPLSQRIQEAQRVVQFVLGEIKKRNLSTEFSLSVKHFEFPVSHDSSGLILAIRKLTEYMVNEFGLTRVEQTNDGIIFEPQEASLHLDTLKWKFPSNVTVDLQLKKRHSSSFQTLGETYDLYVNNNTIFNFLSPGATSNRLQDRTYATITFPSSESIFGLDSGQLSGLIGEFGYNTKTSSFVLHRIRWDKEYANAYTVVDETFQDILYVKTLPYVLSQIQGIESFEGASVSFEKISEVYRKKANLIKDRLIQEHCVNRTVLDIGSGKGGDLQKYERAKTKHVYLVEPNRKFVQLLRGRLQELRVFSHTIIQAGGEDTQTILQQVPPQSVDVITMMQSLTYFFQNEEMLNRLIQTISTCLTPQGSVVGAVMRGEKVYDCLQENDFFIKRNAYSIHLEGLLDPMAGTNSPSTGKIITTHLQGTETAEQITEGLVYLSVLSEHLDPYNLTLTECNPFCQSAPFLLDPCIIEKERARMKAFQEVERDVVQLFGEVARSKLRLFVLGVLPQEDPIILQSSKYLNPEYNVINLPSIDQSGNMATFESVVMNLFKPYVNENYTEDEDLIIKDGQVKYGPLSFSIRSVPMIKSTTLLDKHYFAAAIRRSYFGNIQPYQFDYAKLGYSKTSPIIEAFACPEHHYFTYYCSPFSDVHPGSLGRFEDIRRWSAQVVYIIPPSTDVEYLRMILPSVLECAKQTTVVLIIPSIDVSLQAVEQELGDKVFSRRAYSNLLTHRETKKEVAHVEYCLGIKRDIQNRRVIADGVVLNEEETRLFGLYSTFVYETVVPIDFTIDHPMAEGPEIGIILRDKGTSLLQSILMSYLGGSYYSGLEDSFMSSLVDGYQYYEFRNSPISLELLKQAIANKPEEVLKILTKTPQAIEMRDDLFTGEDWLKFYKGEMSSTKAELKRREELNLVLFCLFENTFKPQMTKHLIQMCCDRMRVCIVVVHLHNVLSPLDVYKGQRVDEVVFIAFDDSRYIYHPVRVLHTSRGAISQEAGLQYSWYPVRQASNPTRIKQKPESQTEYFDLREE